MGSFFRQLNTGMGASASQVLGLLQKDPDKHWKPRQVAEALGWSLESGPKKATRTLNRLIDMGRADGDEPIKGKPTLYWHVESTQKVDVGLTTPEDLAARWVSTGGHLDTAWTNWLSMFKPQQEK